MPPVPRARLEVGNLSSWHESRWKPQAINRKDVGGPSYGLYQISTRVSRGGGSPMAAFLAYVQKNNPAIGLQLTRAGGAKAAKELNEKFISTWKHLATDAKLAPTFSGLQTSFVNEKLYTPAVRAIRKLGLDPDKRSATLRAVVWSMAVQHPTKTRTIFRTVLGHGGSALSDKELIRALYKERSKTFPRQTDRYEAELKDALKILETEQH